MADTRHHETIATENAYPVAQTDFERAHLLVASGDPEFVWRIFDGLDTIKEKTRVTACVSGQQVMQICAADPPDVMVVDLDYIEGYGGVNLSGLAGSLRWETHIIALTDHPFFHAATRLGNARLTYVQNPVETEDLLDLLRTEATWYIVH